jgi:prevent-host-death family protein
MSKWAVATAKAQFSEVIEKAMTEGPQEITKSGKAAVVMISAAEWERLKPEQENLADFLIRTAPKDTGFTFARVRGKARAAKF